VNDSARQRVPSKSRTSVWAAFWRWPAAVLLTLVLHYVWEMVQAPLFTEFVGADFWSHAWPCFQAAVGDLIIATCAYTAAAAAFRRPAWPFHDHWKGPLVVCLLVGLTITIAFEWYALATDRWTYAETMPMVAGVGLSPLVQWIAVPYLTLLLLRALQRRIEK